MLLERKDLLPIFLVIYLQTFRKKKLLFDRSSYCGPNDKFLYKTFFLQIFLVVDCVIRWPPYLRLSNRVESETICRNLFVYNLVNSTLLFFAVYVIYKKNYSFSRVVFHFFQTKIANSFYSKINDSGRLWTTSFSSSRFRVRVTALLKIFTIYPWYFSIPGISETLRGSPTKIFGTVRQEIFDGKPWYSPPSYP